MRHESFGFLMPQNAVSLTAHVHHPVRRRRSCFSVTSVNLLYRCFPADSPILMFVPGHQSTPVSFASTSLREN